MLRQLKPDGTAKLDHELTPAEVEGRRLELEDDRRMEVVRAVRAEQEDALLDRVRSRRGESSVLQAVQEDQKQLAAESKKK